MHELVGNMHMHTPYSDGEKWHAEIAEAAITAGLDFVIVTDHNVWVDGVEGYYENENGRILLITGEEVHNVRRQPQASHMLIYGAEREMSSCAPDPQALIDAVNELGGYTFLAHPHENNCRILPNDNLGWHDWDIEGFTGLEIWNYMSSFVNRMAEQLDKLPIQNGMIDKLTAAYVSYHQEKYITTPEPQTLALWDKFLAEGKHIAAIGNSDAHGLVFKVGSIEHIIYPYDYLFRCVNTHILLDAPLSDDLAYDKKRILTAVGKGNSWVGYDLPQTTKGFRFSGHATQKGIMGDRIHLNGGSATLQVIVPTRTNIRMIRHGEIVAEVQNETNLTHIPVKTGAYRVECTIPYLGKERGWIYSNPIYLF